MASQTQSVVGIQRGTVVWWKPERGYGFLRSNQGKDVFCHFSAIETRAHPKNLLQGQVVEFEVAEGPKGPFASRVRVVVP